jgi:cell division protein FtsW
MKKETSHPVDKILLWITLLLVTVGAVVFVSATLGILAKSETRFYSVLVSQLVFGLIGGVSALLLTLWLPYGIWKKYAFFIFIFTLLSMFLVFIPGLGYEHGGARRWVSLGFVSFQPAELLKCGFILYAATWFSWIGKKVKDARFTTLPLIVMLGVAGALLLIQPDTKSLVLMIIAGSAMLFVSGTPIKHIAMLGAGALVLLIGIGLTTPYIQNRVKTFLDPSHDPGGASYQLQQSLIAIGSGGLTGRGIGQGIQKFGYLPEPQGDSIFAVVGEEVGFIGSVLIVLLYTAFAIRGLRIAYYAPDRFGRVLVIGIITLLWAQSFLNIASITSIIPLTGVPLVFMSHGGTSLMISLGLVGIVLNISRYQKETI